MLRLATRFGGIARLQTFKRWRASSTGTVAPPATWDVTPAPSFSQGLGQTYNVANTGPISLGYTAGGTYDVDVNGQPLPAGITLSAAGMLTDGGATAGNTTGVIFGYNEPNALPVLTLHSGYTTGQLPDMATIYPAEGTVPIGMTIVSSEDSSLRASVLSRCARFEEAEALAHGTAGRALERLAGGGLERRAPWSDALGVAVWNPSPHPRSGVVRFALDPHPWLIPAVNPVESIHPLLLRDLAAASFTADGAPARLVPAEAGRVKLLPERGGFDLEFVARDVPAFGWKRVVLRKQDVPAPDEVARVAPGSAEAAVEAAGVRVAAAADGRVEVAFGARRFEGLFGVEDVGDRGDSYDFDLAGADDAKLVEVSVERFFHAAGIAGLRIARRFSVPARLDADRETRSRERAELRLELELRVASGLPRVDAVVRLWNGAEEPAAPAVPGRSRGRALRRRYHLRRGDIRRW